jgi:murein DD-endopeptidase MepM/ murein hydrolase activator NlpD
MLFLGLISKRDFIEEYMNYKLNPNTNSSHKTFLYFLIKQGISLIGILSLLSSSIVVAQTEPTTPESTQQRTQTEASTPRTTLKARKVNLKASQFGFNDKKPKKVTKLVEKSSSYNRTSFYLADSGKNSYVDTTDYNTTPPPVNNPDPAPTTAVQPKTTPKVVITERASGCSIVANGSQIQSNGCGGNRRQTTRVRTRTTAVKQPTQNVSGNRIRRTITTDDRVATRNQPVYHRSQLVVRKRLLDSVDRNQVVVSSTNTKSYSKSLNTTKYSTQQITNPNKNSRPLTVVSLPDDIQAIPLSEFANYVAARNATDNNSVNNQVNTIQQTGDRLATANINNNPARKTALLYPLPIPARFSSPFGWRIHPITGVARMHSGTDIAASLGTPVLAAYSGRVEFADSMGGYGLAITLRHANDTQESLYGHLSQILVQPGEFVEQGTVIGLVGSTGNSTGPHLHFEWRYLTTDGWVAVDAGQHLQYALDNLIQAMQMAKIADDTDENKVEETKITDEDRKSEVKKLEVKKLEVKKQKL